MPLRLIAIISKANSPYFTLLFHGLWTSPRPETIWNSSYNGWLPTVSYETQSPTVIGLLSHPFPVSRPRPWTLDFLKWRREWRAEKIIPPLKRQLTFISVNWCKANGSAGTKGPSKCFITNMGNPRAIGYGCKQNWYRGGYLHSFDMENGHLQILWTAKTVYAKLANTSVFSPHSTDPIKFIFLFGDHQRRIYKAI